jgi:hypothetical protein
LRGIIGALTIFPAISCFIDEPLGIIFGIYAKIPGRSPESFLGIADCQLAIASPGKKGFIVFRQVKAFTDFNRDRYWRIRGYPG